MKLIYNRVFLEHDTGMHPENKKRLESLGDIPETEVDSGEGYLELFHKKEYAGVVKEVCERGGHLDPDTVVSPGTYDAAVHAVGATIMASQSNDFAAVRPPGHHAYPDHSSGFCIFNNIAIAVQKLVNEGKKVLIFDFDAHLGDGTVKFFYNTDKVMYWSLHQSPAFPGGGTEDEVGEGKGEGYTINCPMPAGSGDDIYMDTIKRFMPIARQYDPDVVACSAGFDAHKEDLLLDLRLSVNAYYKIGKVLSSNFSRIFATLEGGYNTIVFPKCVFNFIDGINGEKQRFKERSTDTMIQIRDEYEARILCLEKNLRRFWKI
jgi:acetoin utilization deacetylase AcuC-like enzyme